jgi:hypothetical protein
MHRGFAPAAAGDIRSVPESRPVLHRFQPPGPKGRKLISVADQFLRDMLRMIAMLFAPMLIGALVIPLLMLVFSLLGYPY